MTEPSAATLREILANTRTIAVLGAHDAPERPAFYVPEYLHRRGYEVRAVNPARVGIALWGRPVVAGLGDLDGPIDLVDVFRRPEFLLGHVPEILAMRPLPKVVWFQSGIRHAGAAAALRAAGIVVIEDRCTLAEHQRLLGPGHRAG